MNLCFSPGAGSPSPHIVLREAGLPFTGVKVRLRTTAMEGGGDSRAIQPKGYVPLIEFDDGARLSEGPAIVQYVADRAPQSKPSPGGTGDAESRRRDALSASSMRPGGDNHPALPALTRRASEGRGRRACDLTDGEPE